jgi:hypothetical protein
MSIPSQNKNSWGDVLTDETDANRRHSYDVNMSWQTMSEAFLERPDLLLNISSSNSSQTASNAATSTSTSSSSLYNQQQQQQQFHPLYQQHHPYHPHHPHQQQLEAPVFKQENFYNNTNSNSTPTKVSWSHDDLHIQPPPAHLAPQHPHHQQPSPTHQQQYNQQGGTQSVEYSNHPISPRQHNRLYHPTMSSPLAPHPYHPRYAPIPAPPNQQQQQEHHPGVMLHPLARQPGGDLKPGEHPQQQHQYYSYTFPPQQHPMQPGYYYPPPHPNAPGAPGMSGAPVGAPRMAGGKVPMDPSQQQYHSHPPPILAKPKRKKQKSSNSDGYNDDEEIVETNEEDYPDMSTRDVEAARTDPEARPRKQKLRFTGDAYTPQWVRYNGQSKEGLCDTCKPGKWLQLKNSAYW